MLGTDELLRLTSLQSPYWPSWQQTANNSEQEQECPSTGRLCAKWKWWQEKQFAYFSSFTFFWDVETENQIDKNVSKLFLTQISVNLNWRNLNHKFNIVFGDHCQLSGAIISELLLLEALLASGVAILSPLENKTGTGSLFLLFPVSLSKMKTFQDLCKCIYYCCFCYYCYFLFFSSRSVSENCGC